jgi:hypothetical protein
VSVVVEAPQVAPTLDEETRNVLRVAKERIAKGWCQGNFIVEGSYCILGALGWFGTGGRHDEAIRILAGLIGKSAEPKSGLWLWNDDPDRTQAEVVALLDRALGA